MGANIRFNIFWQILKMFNDFYVDTTSKSSHWQVKKKSRSRIDEYDVFISIILLSYFFPFSDTKFAMTFFI